MDEEEFVRDLVRSTVEEEIGDLPIAQVQVRLDRDQFDAKIYRVGVIYDGPAVRLDPDKTAAILRKLVSRLWESCEREEDFGFPVLSWLPESVTREREAEFI
jgi:hypothetical protein